MKGKHDRTSKRHEFKFFKARTKFIPLVSITASKYWPVVKRETKTVWETNQIPTARFISRTESSSLHEGNFLNFLVNAKNLLTFRLQGLLLYRICFYNNFSL